MYYAWYTRSLVPSELKNCGRAACKISLSSWQQRVVQVRMRKATPTTCLQTFFRRMNQAAQATSPHLFTRSTIARSPELQDRNDQEKPLLFLQLRIEWAAVSCACNISKRIVVGEPPHSNAVPCVVDTPFPTELVTTSCVLMLPLIAVFLCMLTVACRFGVCRRAYPPHVDSWLVCTSLQSSAVQRATLL